MSTYDSDQITSASHGAGHAGAVRRLIKSYGPWMAHRLLAAEIEFVILTAGRAGSELLVELLDSHPQIMCDGEILAVHRWSPEQFLVARAAIAGWRRARAYGFKLLREHVVLQRLGDPAAYLRALHARGYRIILLERRDMLRQAISYLSAAADRYHYRRHDGAAFAPVRLDPLAILATMFMLEDAVGFGRSALAETPHLRIVYEDHLADTARHQATADLVCNYLGIPPAGVSSDLVRIGPTHTAELLENFDEVAALLSGTRYSAYVTGVEVAAN